VDALLGKQHQIHLDQWLPSLTAHCVLSEVCLPEKQTVS